MGSEKGDSELTKSQAYIRLEMLRSLIEFLEVNEPHVHNIAFVRIAVSEGPS